MSTYSEILEQGQWVGELLAKQQKEVIDLAHLIKKRGITNIFLAARGTSDNAGRYANYLFGNRNRLTLALAAPSLFTHYKTPPNLSNSLVLCISQSGQSPDIVEVAAEGKRQNCLSLAITNSPDSPLAANVDCILNLNVGVESGVAATKTYTAELLLLAMLSSALLEDPKSWQELDHISEWMEQVLQLDEAIARIVQRYRYMEHCVVLGRGYNYSTAFEWALKLKELTYSVAEAYSPADFLHGPVAMIERGYPILMVAAKGAVFKDILTTQKMLKEHLHGEIIAISNSSESLNLAQSALGFSEQIPEWLSPIIAIVPAQFFAYHLSLAKGFNPDHPRSIQKITKTT